MVDDLLQTKLFTPRVRPSLVARPRLIEILNQGLAHKLTLLSAPAGFGKTTLVSNWLAEYYLPLGSEQKLDIREYLNRPAIQIFSSQAITVSAAVASHLFRVWQLK